MRVRCDPFGTATSLSTQATETCCAAHVLQGLSREEVQEIQKGLKQMLKPGQSLVLEEKIDPSIISGIVLDIGDKHLDCCEESRGMLAG